MKSNAAKIDVHYLLYQHHSSQPGLSYDSTTRMAPESENNYNNLSTAQIHYVDRIGKVDQISSTARKHESTDNACRSRRICLELMIDLSKSQS